MKKHTIDAVGKLGLVLLQSAKYMTIIVMLYCQSRSILW